MNKSKPSRPTKYCISEGVDHIMVRVEFSEPTPDSISTQELLEEALRLIDQKGINFLKCNPKPKTWHLIESDDWMTCCDGSGLFLAQYLVRRV